MTDQCDLCGQPIERDTANDVWRHTDGAMFCAGRDLPWPNGSRGGALPIARPARPEPRPVQQESQ